MRVQPALQSEKNKILVLDHSELRRVLSIYFLLTKQISQLLLLLLEIWFALVMIARSADF